MSKIKGYRCLAPVVSSLLLALVGGIDPAPVLAGDHVSQHDATRHDAGAKHVQPAAKDASRALAVPQASRDTPDITWMASRHPALTASKDKVSDAKNTDLSSTRAVGDASVADQNVATTKYRSEKVTATASATVTTSPSVPSKPLQSASLPTAPSNIDSDAVRAVETQSVEPEKTELYVIVLAGDTGLNAHSQRVRPGKAWRHGRGHTWDWTTRKIAPLIDGHINFANIETVVTERNSLRPSSKKFNFRMHPNGARHLVDIGFNLFSLANNHSADYGAKGVLDTLVHSEKLRTSGLRGFAGLGVDRDHAIRSDSFNVGRSRFGFAAMGIGARQPGPSRAGVRKPGQVNIYGSADFNDVLSNLVEAPVDYRILSMHFGAERNVRPLSGQVAKWRDEVQLGHGIDLIVGHHAHVAQGVQINNGKLIFYGLGNFLHLGMQDMAKFNACRDYGVLGRVFVVRQPDGSMEAQAVQVVPLKDMHLQAKPRTGKAAALRIDVLNMLAEELDDNVIGSRGVRFAKQADGTGLFCRSGAANGPGRLGALCRGFTPAPALSKRQRSRLRSMCRLPSRQIAKTKGKSRKKTRKQRRVKVWRGTDVFTRQ